MLWSCCRVTTGYSLSLWLLWDPSFVWKLSCLSSVSVNSMWETPVLEMALSGQLLWSPLVFILVFLLKLLLKRFPSFSIITVQCSDPLARLWHCLKKKKTQPHLVVWTKPELTIVQVGLKLMAVLPQPPKFWNCRHDPSYPASLLLLLLLFLLLLLMFPCNLETVLSEVEVLGCIRGAWPVCIL